ncbi:hypothetical protein BCR34DRAFT_554302 [Clohesyomyces aquaticus]|uniref:GH64 domain-containing protein n=1 Tax=Clohesyomyces aquaticus TaxID=1231657 RepID=A0A1Y2A6N4_9PLEO|nr:hypothetical protein BCR34DRAFT_554302 [Clohesyomyces aquaticus]
MKGFVRKLIAKHNPKNRGSSSGATTGTTAPAPNEGYKGAPPAQENRMAAPQDQKIIATAAGTLQVALQNKTPSSNVFAYITGLDLNNGNKPIFIQSDGRSVYSPTSPTQPGANLSADVAISLGAPGNTVNVQIPKIAGGRIWFSIDARLTFLVNPGPAIVEPSVTNPSDPNFNISWTFCEFTYNDAQLFANISYVDFVSVPVGIALTNAEGKSQSVPGMPASGFNSVIEQLRAQAQKDGRPWDKLIYEHNGKPLRALSPNNLLVGNANVWGNYWDGYVDAVWNRFSSQDIIINTQAAAGNLRGRIYNNMLSLGEAGTFSRPNAADIFSCSTGPFATGSNQARNAVIPRLAAAFNRSTLLLGGDQFPNGHSPQDYYKDATTNHYARIVHQVQRDGRGYAFPYDDVVPDGGQDVAGTVFDGSPRLFTVSVGGG